MTEQDVQEATAAALSADRQQLADLGVRQAQQLLQTAKEILDAYSNLQPSVQAQQRLQQLQETYLRVSQEIRTTLQQCRDLESQEAAAQEAAAAAAAGAGGSDNPEALLIAQLEAEAAELRQQLQAKNALIKQVIDKLRHVLDAFSMWDGHQHHLLQHAVQFAAAGSAAT